NALDTAGTGAGGDARFRQRFDTKVQMPGYTGAADGTTGSPTVVSYIQGLNPSGPPAVTSISSTAAGGGFFNTPGGGACTQPSLPSSQLVPNQILAMQQDDMLSPEMVNDISADNYASVQTATKSTGAAMPSLKFTSDVPRQPSPLPERAAAPLAPVSVAAGTLPASKSIIIKFRVTVN